MRAPITVDDRLTYPVRWCRRHNALHSAPGCRWQREGVDEPLVPVDIVSDDELPIRSAIRSAVYAELERARLIVPVDEDAAQR